MAATSGIGKPQKIVREFDFKLTAEEKASKREEACELLLEAEKIEIELKEHDAGERAKIKERYELASKLAQTAKLGTETRTEEALMTKDFATATKRFFIAEKLIHEEAMTASELQMELGDVADPKSNSPEDLGYKKPKKPAKTARDGRLEDAQKAIASKKKGKASTAEVVALETNRKTKRASTDGVYK
jgi:hypothetical protein